MVEHQKREIAKELPAGTQNIGDVDVATLPSIPAGDNNIGNVDVVTQPSTVIAGMTELPSGENLIGDVGTRGFNYSLFEDNFDDDTLDTANWDALTVASGTVAETNNRIEITTSGDGDFAGIVTDATRDLRGAEITVDFDANTNFGIFLQICLTSTTNSDPGDENDYYRIGLVTTAGGQCWVHKRKSGGSVTSSYIGTSFESSNKIKIVIEDSTIKFYEGVHERYSESYDLSSYDCYIYLYGQYAYATGGTAYADNFKCIYDSTKARVRISDDGNVMTEVAAALPAGTNIIGKTYITDGTNTMPTMDVVGRAGYVEITDGSVTPIISTPGDGKAAFNSIYTVSYLLGFNGTTSDRLRSSANKILLTEISDGTETATVTADGYLDVKTHTPEVCFAQDYGAAQAAQVIITPTSGKKIKIVSVYASTEAVATDITLQFTTSGNIFYKLYTSVVATAAGNNICATGATNETISLTCGAGTFISIGYDEVT